MRPARSILLLFLLVPILEVLLFIVVGSRIGIGWTIGLVVLTAVLGAMLVTRQGRATLEKARQDVAAGVVPARPLVHGVMILIAGALLLTPGFLTDAVGFALLIPGVREAVRRWAAARFRPDVTIIP